MVTEITYSRQILAAHNQAANVFTPGAPIDAISLFRGRDAQMQMLLEAVSQIGQHAIVYGERGVGKTSLISVLYELVTQSALTGFHIAHVNCDVEDTFGSLWRKIFREIQVDSFGKVTTLQPISLDTPHSLADHLGDAISPDDIRRLCSLVDGQLVVIIDEFDQLSGNVEIIRLVANTIKTLSDRRTQVTLILVGVANTVSQLVTEHESVERNLVQIQMPRMSDQETGLIITEGLASLGFTINEGGLAYVCSLSQGLPASAHRIGLQMAHHMIETNGHMVGRGDVDASLDRVIDRMPQSHLMDWQSATEGSRNKSLFEAVLIAAALAPRSEQGWFQSNDILEPFRSITDNGQYKANSYSQHLYRLTTQRGTVLERSKSDGHWQFRFRNPSFQSYVLMKGLASGRLNGTTLSQFNRSFPAVRPAQQEGPGQTYLLQESRLPRYH